MEGDKVATTLNINKWIKKDFKIECTKNSVDMSETVEQMMEDYTKVSREIHDIRNDPDGRE